MEKRLLLGTRNPAKVDLLRALFARMLVEFVTVDELGIAVDVREDGRSPEENALKKARAYFDASRMPTLAIDGALSIARFPEDKQPGVYVRRIYGERHHVSDREVQDYYAQELARVGGKSNGTWHIALVLITAGGRAIAESFALEVMFTSSRRGELTPGVPLDALMIDPRSGRYYSQMSYPERPDSVWVLDFVVRHLNVL